MKRHQWKKLRRHFRKCQVCGLEKTSVPHPYERTWFAKWRLPNGNYVDTDGELPIACIDPPEETPNESTTSAATNAG